MEISRPIDYKTLFSGFSKLNRAERLSRLVELGALERSDIRYLNSGGIQDIDLAEKFIENVIGYFQMPLGVATNFRIDNKDYVIPMAVEETSIVAASSKTAKWIRERGYIHTKTLGKNIIGQIQLAKVKSFEETQKLIQTNKHRLIQLANEEVAAAMVKRGGGVLDLQTRKVPRGDGSNMAVVHVIADTCDAMGANIINQVCEFLKDPIEELTGETVTMCILSNLVDTKLTQAQILIPNIDPVLGNSIVEASLFAQQDPYRAATNNKGVLNGMDAVLIATGNDWRAVEAGLHAFAAQSGQYRSITKWELIDGDLIGTLVAPISVGTIGGVTSLHPTARMCLQMLKLEDSAELARIVAAVGLVQNLGAIRALVTEGIIRGHMKLHIENLALGAGALESEVPLLKRKLEELLAVRKRISLSHASEILQKLRMAEG